MESPQFLIKQTALDYIWQISYHSKRTATTCENQQIPFSYIHALKHMVMVPLQSCKDHLIPTANLVKLIAVGIMSITRNQMSA